MQSCGGPPLVRLPAWRAVTTCAIASVKLVERAGADLRHHPKGTIQSSYCASACAFLSVSLVELAGLDTCYFPVVWLRFLQRRSSVIDLSRTYPGPVLVVVGDVPGFPLALNETVYCTICGVKRDRLHGLRKSTGCETTFGHAGYDFTNAAVSDGSQLAHPIPHERGYFRWRSHCALSA